MAASTYDAALAHVLAHEGGYTNHPSDPGGPTNFGITISDYRRYVKSDASAADIRAMTVTEAKTIYRARYWDAQSCDALPAGVDYAVFDYGVNSGLGRSGKVLRRILGLSDATSAITQDVVRAAAAADARKLIADICGERLRFLQSLKTWPVFGAGWGRRVAEVKSAALAMAAAQPLNEVQGAAPARAQVPLNTKARTSTTGAVVISGGASLQHAHQNGAPVSVIVVLLLLTAALAVGAWLFWRRRQKQLQEK